MAVGVAVVAWIVFCASLTLIFGSGAERYPADDEADFDRTMFVAGVVCFAVGALLALLLKVTGATKRRQEQEEGTGWGMGFLVLTPLAAIVAGVVIDIVR